MSALSWENLAQAVRANGRVVLDVPPAQRPDLAKEAGQAGLRVRALDDTRVELLPLRAELPPIESRVHNCGQPDVVTVLPTHPTEQIIHTAAAAVLAELLSGIGDD